MTTDRRDGAPQAANASGRTGAHGVFITGASSGIGASVARYYAAQAANVGMFARRIDALAALAAEFPAERCATYAGDVRDSTALDRAARDFISRFGAPSVVIANAGVSLGALTEHPDDLPVFRTVIETNVMEWSTRSRPSSA